MERDRVFIANEYYVLRIKTPIPKDRFSYWKVYIEETLKICGEEIQKEKKKIKIKYRKLFTKNEFENMLRKNLKNHNNSHNNK